jgi:hypothetical protein
MPRYFFAIEGEPWEDAEGEDLRDDLAALKRAEHISERLELNRPGSPELIAYNARGERVRIH